jgi:hypothetical protein
MAREAAQTFYLKLANGLAQGTSFSNVCREAGVKPVAMPAVSRAENEAPGLEQGLSLNELKRLAFGVSPGKPTSPVQFGAAGNQRSKPDGTVIVYVKELKPVDPEKMKKELPLFISRSLRPQLSQDAFNLWFNKEFQKAAEGLPKMEQTIRGSGPRRSGS